MLPPPTAVKIAVPIHVLGGGQRHQLAHGVPLVFGLLATRHDQRCAYQLKRCVMHAKVACDIIAERGPRRSDTVVDHYQRTGARRVSAAGQGLDQCGVLRIKNAVCEYDGVTERD